MNILAASCCKISNCQPGAQAAALNSLDVECPQYQLSTARHLPQLEKLITLISLIALDSLAIFIRSVECSVPPFLLCQWPFWNFRDSCVTRLGGSLLARHQCSPLSQKSHSPPSNPPTCRPVWCRSTTWWNDMRRMPPARSSQRWPDSGVASTAGST